MKNVIWTVWSDIKQDREPFSAERPLAALTSPALFARAWDEPWRHACPVLLKLITHFGIKIKVSAAYLDFCSCSKSGATQQILCYTKKAAARWGMSQRPKVVLGDSNKPARAIPRKMHLNSAEAGLPRFYSEDERQNQQYSELRRPFPFNFQRTKKGYRKRWVISTTVCVTEPHAEYQTCVCKEGFMNELCV